uniref:Uncharacterized protein n=1 Tax=Ursus maritimus TaxID=29073 RepID=A0A452TBZ1_URSMA
RLSVPSQLPISLASFSVQCQIRFGGRKEIASDSDSRVTCLCAQFEAVLQHGLKRSRGLALTAAAIKQAAGFTSKTETGTDAAQRMESFLKSFYLFFNSGQSGIVWEWDGGSLMV